MSQGIGATDFFPVIFGAGGGANNFEPYPTQGDFPIPGDPNVLYLDLSTSSLWYWDGVSYHATDSPAMETAANFAALPVVGAVGVLYVTTDNGNTFRWNGSSYQPLGIWPFRIGLNTFGGKDTLVIENQLTNNPSNVSLPSPKGTVGGLVLGIPDGTATGGNQIGNGAISLVTGRSTATQGATGPSAIAAGYRATASGNNSTAMGPFATASNGYVAVGSNTTASGAFSVVLGQNITSSGANTTAIGTGTVSGANSTLVGQGSLTHAGTVGVGRNVNSQQEWDITIGNLPSGFTMGHGQRISATRVQFVGGSASSSLFVPINTMGSFQFDICVYNGAGGGLAEYMVASYTGAYVNNNGTLTLIGTPTLATFNTAGAATWTPNMAIVSNKIEGSIVTPLTTGVFHTKLMVNAIYLG